MAVIPAEWAMSNPLRHQDPETYAPAKRRVPEEPTGDARVAFLRLQNNLRSQANDRSAENLDVLVQRIAGTAMDEIDHAIRELESVREMLRNQGERVSQQIAGYASSSQASMTAMKIISNNLKVWNDSLDRSAY
jgi:hypothetical protein